MSNSISKSTQVVDYTEALGRLGRQTSHREFFDVMESLINQVLGRREFTIVGTHKEVFCLVFSNRWKSSESRLTFPPVDREPVAIALSQVPAEIAGPVGPTVSWSVEGKVQPVSRIWKLGSRDGDDAHIIFHDDGDEGHWPCGEESVLRVYQGVTAAYYRFFENQRLHEEAELLRAKLEAINAIGELIGSLDLEVLLTKLMELSLYVVQGQVGSIIMVREGDPAFESPIEWGLPIEMAGCFRNRDGRPIFQEVIETKKSVAVTRFGNDEDYRVEGPNVQVDSYLCMPLVSKTDVIGVVNLVNSSCTDIDREVLMTICSLAATTIENARLHQDSLEKERYQESLKIARDIQKKLYPSESPDLPWLDIASRTESCDETGGDYYDFLPYEDESGMTMVIGDVSGHGIGAALHMVAARSGLRAMCGPTSPLAETMMSLNDQLEQDMEIEQFMTMFVTSFAPGSKIEFVNAGHDAPCVYRAKTQEIELLDATGMPLGLFAGVPYTLGEVAGLGPGDVMLAMTDGVWEVHNPEGEMLGKDPVAQVFRELCLNLTSSDEIADLILAHVNEYTEGSPPRDDVTLVVIRAPG